MECSETVWNIKHLKFIKWNHVSIYSSLFPFSGCTKITQNEIHIVHTYSSIVSPLFLSFRSIYTIYIWRNTNTYITFDIVYLKTEPKKKTRSILNIKYVKWVQEKFPSVHLTFISKWQLKHILHTATADWADISKQRIIYLPVEEKFLSSLFRSLF